MRYRSEVSWRCAELSSSSVRLPGSIGCGCSCALRSQWSVALRTAVAEKLPDLADFGNHVEIEIGDHDFIFVAAGLGDDLAARIAEITLSVEFADAPGLFDANAIDGADEVTVGDGMSRLLEFPQIFREAGHCGRGIKDDFGAIESENARAFGKVPVVTDVNADAGVFGFENRVAEITGREIKLFPEAGMAVRDMVLAILAEIAAIGVDDGGRIEIDTRHVFFVDGNDDHHLVFGGDFLHELRGGAIGNALDKFVPAGVLFRAKVRAVEELLDR